MLGHAGNDWLHGYRYIRRERLRTFVLSLFLCMVLILSFTIFSEFTIMTRPNMLEIYEQETSYSQITRTVWDLYPEGSTEATLARNVRILCWIMTMPENHDTKALAVKKTWGERCNILLFVSSTYDRTLPSVPLVNKEGREYLWSKTVAAFNYIHRKGYLRDVDWVLKADDDTFVVMENLRLFLSDLDPDRALYMGLLLKWPDSNPYMAGGPGYVLSRTSARRLVEEALPNGINCSEQEADFEDIEMGKCMTQIDAEFVDTRDEQGRNRFHADQPDTYMAPGSFPDWYRMAIVHNISKGMHKCCADTTISFHYVNWQNMYNLYFATYRLNPISTSNNSFNKRRSRRIPGIRNNSRN